ELSEYLGIVPRHVDGTLVGGCSFMILTRHAAAAIKAGLCDVALVTHGESGRSRVGARGFGGSPQSPQGQFEMPYGVFGPPSMFPMGVARHMAKYGTTSEQLAAVAVSTRQWAMKNPRAMMRDPITIEDVLNSRIICWPMHLLDCCLVTDGGGALVIVSAERAQSMGLGHPPVYLLGAGEATEHVMISMMADMTSSAAYRKSGEEAFKMAGVTHKDIDHLMFYDAFTHTPLYAIEDLGFVKKGEGGPWMAEMHGAPGGDLPLNTNGGGLSYTHTGMYGMFAIQEACRQLRGEGGERQVPNVKISLVHGPGGMFSAASTLILTNEPPTAA
ncbi:MAG TPA: thiolase, partial [Dehalococcoidia bacterium]|nr:thiolase [Dehalococcoidia bacterium]